MMINRRLIALVPQSKKHILKNVFFQWISLLANILFMVSIGEFLQRAFANKLSQKFYIVQVGIAIVFITTRFACARMANKESYRASKYIKKILRSKIYEKLLRVGTQYTKQISTADILQSSMEGVEQLEIYFGSYLPQLLYSLLAPLTLFCVLSFVQFSSALALLGCVPLIPLSIIAIQKFSKKLIAKYWGQYTKLGDSFLENLQGLTTLKIYQSDHYKHQKMNEEAEQFRKITMKVLMMQLNSITLMDLIAYGGTALGVILAVNGLASGSTDFKGCFIIIMLCAEFFLPLRLLGSFFHVAMNGMAASDKIFSLLDLEETAKGTLKTTAFDIAVENLSFGYHKNRTVLNNVSLIIPSHSFVSIVGKSGCGKSTIAQLLAGNYNDYLGSIKIGGVELSQIDENFLRKSITLIEMSNYIFKGTVRDNLTMGAPHASESELWNALEKVNLANFLKGEQGLDTPLAEQGNNFSGGQRQRLAVARALLHNSEVYIFDEATSNIDVESENDILGVLHTLATEKTVVFISHRLVNVVQSDTIYVLDNGQVAEHGTHSALLARNQVYADLWNAQYELEQYGKGVQE